MKRARRGVLPAVTAILMGVLSISTVAAAQPPGPGPEGTPAAPSATAQPPAQARTKHAPVLPAQRWAPGSPQAARLRQHQPAPAQPAVAHLAPQLNRLAGVPGSPKSGVRTERDGRVMVTVTGSGAPAAARAVGARVLAGFEQTTTVLVTPGRLRELAGQPGVSRVAPAVRPMPQDTSEGVAASGAQNWADSGNVGNGGSGVKVGIVDLGFADLQAELAAHHFDDPDGNQVSLVYPAGQNHCADDGLTAHGTAVSEVVHQMAPRATLYLYCIDDNVGFSAAAAQAVAAGVKIVNSSLVFTAETRGDGYGPSGSSEQAVRAAREAGVLWIQSSGNGAQDHWSGTLADANGDEFVDLQSTVSQADEVALDAGYTGNVVLSWDQWPASSLPVTLAVSEYDDNNAQIGETEYLDQVAGDPPVLELDISNLSTDPGYTGDVRYFDVVVLVGPRTPALHYNLYYGGDVSPSFLSGVDPARAAAGSVLEPASSPWALAVGAAFRGNNVLEPFSSRGPTIDGRVKPDLLGYDGVSSNISEEESSQYDQDGNVVPGTTGFYGTSAAAPHVAGAAALVAAANPAMDASDLEDFLQRRADPAGNPPTNAAGFGLLQLGATTGIQAVPGSQYFPFANPTRIVDTRTGLGVRKGLMGAGTALAVPVASTGTNAVPAGATSVVISLSGTGAQGGTYLSVYSKVFGGNSTLNLNSKDANATVTALVKLNSSHGFMLRNAAAPTHALITVLGYFGAPSATGGLGYVALPSKRLLDTRVPTGIAKVAKLTPNQAVTVDAGPGGVPADATVAVVNMTALNQTAGGYLTAYPNASPAVASVDYRQYSRSNLVAVPLVNRKFVVQNRFAYTDAMIDIVGYFSPSATARFVTLANPRRIADTRTGNGGHYGTMTANASFSLDAGGLYGVPYTVSGLWVGLTAIAAGNGYLSIYPRGSAAPHASNMDFTTGRVVPNAAIATLSAGTSTLPPGFSTIDRFGSSQILEDAYGYFVTSTP
ncbi:S8 family serine peptidase [Jatrophihabitans sp.]|uniref:S8 family serine peptidase n=1 Tax=Jatrophihabitans sp. TaxID=1932789 RepID=UPI002B51498A|nr:S8 family serine peptidase [Jatrophihabitans sp.]